METTTLANRISSLRKSRGLSQEELAERSSISLRTLQRIESGTTQPRGHTLRLLAESLDTSAEDLQAYTSSQDKTFLHIMNLASLAFWLFPLANLLLPWVLWMMKKDTVDGAEQLGRRILTFQLAWSILTYGIVLVFLFSAFTGLPETMPWLGIVAGMLIVVLYLINSVLILLATVRINRGDEQVYWFNRPKISGFSYK
ncbi:helix-turn-helix domain-containing protein [Telluribacter humicola]|uniref:helix-turn-helix domain-containing protein n=1 Tax=Telluribacter humicola TaxID=1720261 RepID=UPI001A965E53|nr:helix-turn-helix domain-containing protein [Telluribacter humicola]